MQYLPLSLHTNILNIIFEVDKCGLFTFAPPIIPLKYVPGHDLNLNASLNLDASLSFLLWVDTWNSKIVCTINKKSAKLKAIHSSSLPHTHIIIISYNKLNSGWSLSIDSVNVNKS